MLGRGMGPKGRSLAYIRSFHLLQEYEDGEKVGEVGCRVVSITDSPRLQRNRDKSSDLIV